MSGNLNKLRTPTCLMGAIYLAMLNCGSAEVKPWYQGGVEPRVAGQEVLLAKADADKKEGGMIFNLHMEGDESVIPLSGSSGWRVAKKPATAPVAKDAPKAEPAKTEAPKAEPVKEQPKAEPAREPAKKETVKAEPAKEKPVAEPAREAPRKEPAKAEERKPLLAARPAARKPKDAAKPVRRQEDTEQPTLFQFGDGAATPLVQDKDARKTEKTMAAKPVQRTAEKPAEKPVAATKPVEEPKPVHRTDEWQGRFGRNWKERVDGATAAAPQETARIGRRRAEPQAVVTAGQGEWGSSLPSVFVLPQEAPAPRTAAKTAPAPERKKETAPAPRTASAPRELKDFKDYPSIFESAPPKAVEPVAVSTPKVKEEAALGGEKIRYFQSDLQPVTPDEVHRLRSR